MERKLLEKKILVEERKLREKQKERKKEFEKEQKLKKLAERKKLKEDLEKKEKLNRELQEKKRIAAKQNLANQRKERERLIEERKKLGKEKKRELQNELKSQKEIEKQELSQRIEDKREIVAKKKIKEQENEEKRLKAKQAKIEILENPKELTQITVINKYDVVKETKDLKKTNNEKEIILGKIEDKFAKKELMRQREEEIQKRKYSYFNRKNNVKKEETIKTKQFFDESSIKRTFKKNNEKIEKNSVNKKKLEKKSFQNDSNVKQKNKKENELLAAIIKKPSSIVELKEQVISSKREILMFESNKEELGIKQKKMLKEFANIIKDKPVKIVIKTFFSKKEKNFDKYKKISKSRSLYIRAFLINQGISHNRIKIETNEENVTKNWKNEVILNFIGV